LYPLLKRTSLGKKLTFTIYNKRIYRKGVRNYEFHLTER